VTEFLEITTGNAGVVLRCVQYECCIGGPWTHALQTQLGNTAPETENNKLLGVAR